ncbi:PTB_TBC1D1_like and TBC domain-containing protein plx isoform X3 [Rhodnius prolixus]|uniref:PTB_TBC1D1_like and TBC domain-containing protein plx isoform X3 n=1 Tax=Rhodnius prolixus TaxID=13249 RepID=UPI003D18FC02
MNYDLILKIGFSFVFFMKMSFLLEYLGHATVDKRLSNPMIPWIAAQIRKGENVRKVSLRVGGTIEVRLEDSNMLVCSHPLMLVSRLTITPLEPYYTLFYTVKDKDLPLLNCHLYQTKDQHTILDIMATMKEQSTKLNKRTTSLCPDISPSSSHFFEVLYIGKINVAHKKVSDTFIDDALDRFNIEVQKREKEQSEQNNSVQENENGKSLNGVASKNGETYRSTEILKCDNGGDPPPQLELRRRSGSLGSTLIGKQEIFGKDNGSANGSIQPEQNRTMVFHVGRTDLRLISPDRKQILLHKYLKDITCSMQGTKHSSHFVFISKKGNQSSGPITYVGFVFKCESPSVAEELVAAISQATVSDKKLTVVSCEHCPMVWYHRLCSDLEGLGDKAAQEMLTRRLDSLPQDELAVVETKLAGAELPNPQASPKEHTELVMMLLRAHCESKQARHVHDTPENRHEFLTNYLGSGTIFMKAKRSLTSSFDQLLKRKGSRDDMGPSLSLPANTTLRDIIQENKTNSPNDTPEGSIPEEPGTPGSMMNIFMKLGSSPKSPSFNERNGDSDLKMQPRSWRQAIFNTVVTPSKSLKETEVKKKDKETYRQLWKKAINQQVLLIRMEKENARLTARQEEANVKRIKLEYEEIGTVECSEIWDMIVKEEKVWDKNYIINALKQGVPKIKRGEVWLHLANQYTSKMSPFNSSNYPNYDVPYEHLLKQLTSYQHAILIDLGRTFPSHSYFSSPLGPGQLALFNILKAYSLLDPEVGYCQGLSFISAVLLLHMSEEEAFYLLKHLMFRRGLRSRYLPDMSALQVSLYQLSRLLHDRHPELYAHFDSLEVAPTLYAAPWLLTMFSSQFPLGFVARIFDLMLADSPDVLFKIALSLLGLHKKALLACDSFEMVMDYMKKMLPTIDNDSMDKLLREVLSINITKELNEYGVEYHVLQEEMSSPRPETKRIKELEVTNLALTQQLQIATSNVNRLESSRAQHMSQLNKLEAQVKNLETTVTSLGQFISDLGYNHKDLNIPNDILRIVTQINVAEKQRKLLRCPIVPSELNSSKVNKQNNDTSKPGNENKVGSGFGRILTDSERVAMAKRKEAREITHKQKAEAVSVAANINRLRSTQSSVELPTTHPLDNDAVVTSFEGDSIV